MTIGEFVPLYLRNHVALLKNRVGTERRLMKYVGMLASKDLAALTKIEVMDWFQRIAATDGPYGANQALEQLKALYNRAIDWDVYAGKNPARGLKYFPKQSRSRFIQENEMPYLLSSIEEELPRTKVYFLTLLFTGCRRDEARTMKWEHLDLIGGLWTKPETKNGRPHTVPLPEKLLVLLRDLPRSHEWVFPSTPNNHRSESGQWSVTAVEHAWRKIRERVGLNDVRIHDLRRTSGSWLAIGGENLPVIMQVLNHSTLTVTQVYSRLNVAPVRRALNQQAERMLNTLTPPPDPEGARLNDWPG